MSDIKPTVKDQILTVLAEAGGPMTPAEVVDATGEKGGTVRVVLSKLAYQGLIHRPRYGVYEANPGGFHKFERTSEDVAQEHFSPRVILAAFRVSGRVVAAVEVRVVQLEPAEIIEVETGTPVPTSPPVAK